MLRLVPLMMVALAAGCAAPGPPEPPAPGELAPEPRTALLAAKEFESLAPGGTWTFHLDRSVDDLWVDLEGVEGAFVGLRFHGPGDCATLRQEGGTGVAKDDMRVGIDGRRGNPERCGKVGAGAATISWTLDAGTVRGRILVGQGAMPNQHVQ